MKPYKIVINKKYGGLGWSDEARQWLDEHGLWKKYPAHSKEERYLSLMYDIPRHEPLLVACVEALQEQASRSGSYLTVKEVTGPYRILEYDGKETVEIGPPTYECPECNPLDVANIDLIVNSALRYALGRHTYIVSTTAEFIRTHWANPSLERMRTVMLKDIEKYLVNSSDNKNDMDRQTWEELYNHLTQNETNTIQHN